MNRSSIARLATVMTAVAAALLALASPALAATITVNETVDATNNGNGKCALREAILAANTGAAVDACAGSSGADTINLPAGNYTLTSPGAGEDAAATGDLDITDDVTINGAGARTTTVDGSDLDRVFDVRGGTTGAEMSGLTITDGAAPAGDHGGGLRNSGGELTLSRVAVDANTAASNGGGVYGSGGTLTVVDSTVSRNSASTAGGLRQNAGGEARIRNSTVSGNHATLNGGVTAGISTVNIESSTIASNTSSSSGGGLLTSGLGSVINVKNSIVSANATTNCDPTAFPGGVIVSQGNNIDSGISCGFGQLTDKSNTDPKLGPLQNNGGPTDTRALLVGSPAIDAGDSEQTADQRGVPRPLDGDGNGRAFDDIGAFEFRRSTFSVSDVSVTEGSSGTTNARFTVTRTDGDGPASVNFATADGTATAPADYTRRSGTLNFAGGDRSAVTVTVPVRPDTIDEPNERFRLNLSAPSPGTSIAEGVGTATIVDDDPAFSVSNVSVTEGDSGTRSATFTVTRTGGRGRASVNFATTDGTARAPYDYTPTSGRLNFADGETRKSVTVRVRGDRRDESHETFALNLSAPVGAGLDDRHGRGTIVDDDPTPRVSIDDVSLREGDSGERRRARFTVSLSSKSARFVTVDFRTFDNTARAPGDYAPRSGSVTFAPGETTQLVRVEVEGDERREANESFFLRLFSPRNAVIGDGRGTATIRNDD